MYSNVLHVSSIKNASYVPKILYNNLDNEIRVKVTYSLITDTELYQYSGKLDLPEYGKFGTMALGKVLEVGKNIKNVFKNNKVLCINSPGSLSTIVSTANFVKLDNLDVKNFYEYTARAIHIARMIRDITEKNYFSNTEPVLVIGNVGMFNIMKDYFQNVISQPKNELYFISPGEHIPKKFKIIVDFVGDHYSNSCLMTHRYSEVVYIYASTLNKKTSIDLQQLKNNNINIVFPVFTGKFFVDSFRWSKYFTRRNIINPSITKIFNSDDYMSAFSFKSMYPEFPIALRFSDVL